MKRREERHKRILEQMLNKRRKRSKKSKGSGNKKKAN